MQDRVVALDERGRNVTSEGFAQLIATVSNSSLALDDSHCVENYQAQWRWWTGASHKWPVHATTG